MSNDAWLIVGLGFYVLLVARGLSKQIQGVKKLFVIGVAATSADLAGSGEVRDRQTRKLVS
jgi:hypothetical protein